MKNLLPTSCFTLNLTSQIFVSLSQNIKDPFPPQFSPPFFLNPKIQPCKKTPRFLLSGEFHTHKLSYKNPYKISLLMDFHFSVLSEFFTSHSRFLLVTGNLWRSCFVRAFLRTHSYRRRSVPPLTAAYYKLDSVVHFL